ncbi:MAG: type VII secretion-associated serine protease mycosin, partial [Actinomycetota bacterium]|nr:type VII secretion-associated serine protease mycosin [Actinomycetota bacterium]
AAIAILWLSGPAWTAAAQTPVLPPPVDLGQRPDSTEARDVPYQAPGQVGLPEAASCIDPAPASGLDPAVIPPGQERMRIRAAQEFATGRGQTVAVIDSGVNPHPRLADRLDDGGDYILGLRGTSDCEGHGTVVAGIIAAAPGDTGFLGVAPDARILAIRQSSRFFEVDLPDRDTGRIVSKPAGDTASLARAVVRAVDTPGVSVINISEAACFPASKADAPPDRSLQAAARYAADRDVVVVAAAANSDDAECRQNSDAGLQTIVSPAWFDEDVLAVGAIDLRTGAPAQFTLSGPWVDVGAPGTQLVSLDPVDEGLTATLADVNGERFPIQGTSFATPFVAGVAALVRERFPELTAREVIERIQRTAQHTAGPGGRDPVLGYGVINPVAALTEILPGPGAVPVPGLVGGSVEPARLEGFRPPVREDPVRRTVAFVGTGVGIAALAGTMLIVSTVRQYRRSTLART